MRNKVHAHSRSAITERRHRCSRHLMQTSHDSDTRVGEIPIQRQQKTGSDLAQSWQKPCRVPAERGHRETRRVRTHVTSAWCAIARAAPQQAKLAYRTALSAARQCARVAPKHALSMQTAKAQPRRHDGQAHDEVDVSCATPAARYPRSRRAFSLARVSAGMRSATVFLRATLGVSSRRASS